MRCEGVSKDGCMHIQKVCLHTQYSAFPLLAVLVLVGSQLGGVGLHLYIRSQDGRIISYTALQGIHITVTGPAPLYLNLKRLQAGIILLSWSNYALTGHGQKPRIRGLHATLPKGVVSMLREKPVFRHESLQSNSLHFQPPCGRMGAWNLEIIDRAK
jgi:hypothetical protein